MLEQPSLFGVPSQPEGARDRRFDVTVEPLILAALSDATVRVADSLATLTLPAIDPTLYARIKPILTHCGFVWKSAQKIHIGPFAAAITLADILRVGTYNDTKRGLEFFATAEATAIELATWVAEGLWQNTPHILEPSAGEGALVAAMLTIVPRARVTAVELDPGRAEHLSQRFAHDPRVTVICADILDLSDASNDHTRWDAAIVNPPFSEAFEHLRHLLTLIRSGGRIAGIVPTVQGKRGEDFADWLNERDAWVEPTRPGAFVDTAVNAAMFGMGAGPSYFDRLLVALEPHPSLRGILPARQLCTLSRDFHTLFERQCNDDLPEGFYEEEVERLETAVRQFIKPEGIEIVIAWDPRAGHGFRLRLPSGLTNDFASSGVIVPPARRTTNW